MAVKRGSEWVKGLLKQLRKWWGKFWYFFWEEDTLLSWIVNIVVAFLLIKGVIYPGLGLMLHTSHPVVAVISTSMEHDDNFDSWWSRQGEWYNSKGITKEEFLGYDFKNGFNRGDIMILRGLDDVKAARGDVVVYSSYIRKEPIIHRVVFIKDGYGEYYYTTKGDRNPVSYPFEQDIKQENVIGKAVLKIPLLGWVKIGFVCVIDSITGKAGFISCMRGA